MFMSAIFQRGTAPKFSLCLCHRQGHSVAAATISCALSIPTKTHFDSINDSHRNERSKRLSSANLRRLNKEMPLSCQPFSTFASKYFLSRSINAGVMSNIPLGSINKENSWTAILTESCVLKRKFQTVGLYHNVADETLHSIQDAVEDYLEDNFDSVVTGKKDDEEDIPEVNYASGVLTIYLPPHGTYVINKQTPNQQIWWSSPISGPRRYDYNEIMKRWVNSRVIDEDATGLASDARYSEDDSLGGALNKEFEELFGEGLGLEA
jgi:frataxin